MKEEATKKVIAELIKIFKDADMEPEEACNVLMSSIVSLLALMAMPLGIDGNEFVIKVFKDTIRQIEEMQKTSSYANISK